MIAYASRTGTRRNLTALRDAGWRLMVSATGVHRTEGFRYAIDNGAWTAFTRGQPWREDLFTALLARHGDGADFIVVPDIVGTGAASLSRSAEWLPRLKSAHPCVPLLVPVQDGMRLDDLRELVGNGVGIFVGGTTDWKLRTMGHWADLARERRAYCHVGRVNTAIRIRMCGRFGVNSFDGSSASRYAETLTELETARDLWTRVGRAMF